MGQWKQEYLRPFQFETEDTRIYQSNYPFIAKSSGGEFDLDQEELEIVLIKDNMEQIQRDKRYVW